jgi:endonuclease YncB( thermonuclease family)
MWQSGAFSTTGKTTTPTGEVIKATSPVAQVVCPDGLTTTVSLKLYNKLNTATSVQLNGTAYIYEVQDGSEALIATSSGTSSNTLDCGKTYRVRLVGADATNSSAKILGIRAGK